MSNLPAFNSWVCGIRGTSFETIINATSRGRAKSAYFSQAHDAFQDLKFTDVWARLNGSPVTPDRLKRCAEYRKFAVKGGSVVQCRGSRGFVVDGNDSANFTVEFFEGEFKGLFLNCHPSELEVVS